MFGLGTGPPQWSSVASYGYFGPERYSKRYSGGLRYSGSILRYSGLSPPVSSGVFVPSRSAPQPSEPPAQSWLVVTVVRSGELVYEAGWRHRQTDGVLKTMKRRLGPAWLERDGSGAFQRRRGRPTPGYLDEHAAIVAKDGLVREVERELAERAAAAERAASAPPTFRDVALAYLDWVERVGGANRRRCAITVISWPSRGLATAAVRERTPGALCGRLETGPPPRSPRATSTGCSPRWPGAVPRPAP